MSEAKTEAFIPELAAANGNDIEAEAPSPGKRARALHRHIPGPTFQYCYHCINCARTRCKRVSQRSLDR